MHIPSRSVIYYSSKAPKFVMDILISIGTVSCTSIEMAVQVIESSHHGKQVFIYPT